MTPKEKRNVCFYRLEQAEQAAEDAEFLYDKHSMTSATNRIYYAMFYAVSALACAMDFNTKKHSGLLAWFNRNLVNEGIVSKEFGKIFNSAYEFRTKGDYADFAQLDSDSVLLLLENVRPFIDCIRQLTLSQFKKDK